MYGNKKKHNDDDNNRNCCDFLCSQGSLFLFFILLFHKPCSAVSVFSAQGGTWFVRSYFYSRFTKKNVDGTYYQVDDQATINRGCVFCRSADSLLTEAFFLFFFPPFKCCTAQCHQHKWSDVQFQ